MSDMLSVFKVRSVGKLSLVGGCLVGLLVGGMAGCSSRLQTTVVSGTEPPVKQELAMVEPEAPQAEDPVQPEKITGIPPMDIPVEEPARPVIRPSAPTEIFATPRTGDAEPTTPAPAESPLPEGSVAPSSPEFAPAPSQTPPQELTEAPGIPPIFFEPEKPSLPTLPEQEGPGEGALTRGEFESVPESDLTPPELTEAPGIPPIFFEPEKPSLPTLPEQGGPGEGALTRGEFESVPESDSASLPEESFQTAKVAPGAPERIETMQEDLMKTLEDVYFDYDRFSVRKDAISVLEENAQVLVEGLSDKSVVIEGHCDERGTESYNMVLGERRAKAVKEFLIYLGVPGEKLQVVSYGKEKPFCTDQNEQCWQENRRSHFVLR